MKWYRIQAIIKRNILAEKRSIMRLSDFFYWPTIDITLWGLTSSWMSMHNNLDTTTVQVMMTCLVLWQVVVRSSYELTIGSIDELWNRSIINLFSTPLTIYEWSCALMILGLLKSCAVVLFGAGVVWLLYGINILSLGIIFWTAVVLLICSGWILGLIGASMIITWGQKVQSTPWIIAFLFAPISAVFYPLDILPPSIQTIARALPTTHVFNAIRNYIFYNISPWQGFMHSVSISILLLLCCYLLLIQAFKKSREKGLARLEQ